MFRPMAFTVVLALAGSLILALTLMPVLAHFAFRRGVRHREPTVVVWLKDRYRPLLRACIGQPAITSHDCRRHFRGVADTRAVDGEGVHPPPRRGRHRLASMAATERVALGVDQEHDDDRAKR